MAIDGTAAKQRERKTQLIHKLSSLKYGPMMLRALCVIALDVDKINELADHELLRQPGIGLKSLQGIRRNLKEYYNGDT